MVMMESILLFLLQDALFLLGYLSRGSAFPRPLNRQEEAALIEGMRQGDSSAREQLITHNLRLCAHIARKYTVPWHDADDLISIGTIGLIKGINTYKPEKGVRLATYASRCIENEILMHFRANKKSAGDLSLSDALDVDS